MNAHNLVTCTLPRRRLLLMSSLALCVFWSASARAVQLLPGVYGYGLDRSINRAGFVTDPNNPAVPEIFHVTSLADSGSATLRQAVGTTTTKARVIVFDISGVIELETPLIIRNSNITIAGQTAPSPGIALHGSGVLCKASNVLVQHLRVRPGDRWASLSTVNTTTNRDAVDVDPGNDTDVVSNVVFDHCTFGWSLDEISNLWHGWDNVTFNKCIFAEPLHNSIHLDEGTFDVETTEKVQNFPWQVEKLAAIRHGFATVGEVQSGTGIDGRYDLINTDSSGDYIEYTVPILPVDKDRKYTHVVLVGVTGPDHAKFKVEVRGPADDTIIMGSEEIVDQYSSARVQQTHVSQQSDLNGFTIPANAQSLRVRLIVTGRNPANTLGWKLGVDQISLSEGHGMGPFWGSGVKGAGKMTVIGSIIAHVADRGPWANSKHFYFANNILYDRSWKFMKFGHLAYWPTDSIHAAVVGNSFIEGQSLLDGGIKSPITNEGCPEGTQVYQSDNVYNTGDLIQPSNPRLRRTAPPLMDPNFGSDGFVVSADPTLKDDGLEGFLPLRHLDAYEEVLRSAGAWPAARDEMEARIVDEIAIGAATAATASRPGTLKHSVAQAGGWPVYLSRRLAASPPAIPTLDSDGDGYTNLEEWLHDLSAQAETKAIAVTDTFEADPVGISARGWIIDPNALGNNNPDLPNNWQVTTDETKVFRQSSLSGDTPAYLAGTNWSGNQVIEAKVKLLATNGADRLARVYARYQDMNHAYYVTLRMPTTVNATTPSIELKKINGAGVLLPFDASSSFPITLNTTYSVKLSVTRASTTSLTLSATVTNLSNPAQTVTLTGTDTSSPTNPIFTLGSAGIGTYKASASFDTISVKP